MKAFKYATGMIGATEPGQRVTKKNIHLLPPGSVVRIGIEERIIHLHDGVWLWIDGCAHCYDNVERMKNYLTSEAVACHVAPPSKEPA